jgi:hypothetical protein
VRYVGEVCPLVVEAAFGFQGSGFLARSPFRLGGYLLHRLKRLWEACMQPERGARTWSFERLTALSEDGVDAEDRQDLGN